MRDRGKTLEMYGFEDLGSRCRKHPTQPSVGICALCLKDRLSKLVCSDCGERRPSSCSCSEASSSSDAAKSGSGKTGTVDIGSVGRISFLIESDKVDPEDPLIGNFSDVKSRPSKPDAIVLLKRSKSAACGTRKPAAMATSGATAAAALDSKVCASKTHSKKSYFWSLLYFGKRRDARKCEGSEPENKRTQGVVRSGQGLDAYGTGEICEGNGNSNPSPLWIFPSLGSRLFRSRSVGCGRSSFSKDRDDDDTPCRLVADINGVGVGNREASCQVEQARAKQSNHRNPVDRVSSTEKGKEECDVKTRGLLAGFRKTGGAFHSISSMISDDGSHMPGASNAWSRGWNWRLSSTIRVFRNSSHGKVSKETRHGDCVSQDTGNTSASSAAEAGALMGIDRG